MIDDALAPKLQTEKKIQEQNQNNASNCFGPILLDFFLREEIFLSDPINFMFHR